MKFPESFVFSYHKVIPGAKQWTLSNTDDKVVISIVGGGTGIYGDGVKTFEMYDFREDDIQGYLTSDEINKYLETHPLVPKGYY